MRVGRATEAERRKPAGREVPTGYAEMLFCEAASTRAARPAQGPKPGGPSAPEGVVSDNRRWLSLAGKLVFLSFVTLSCTRRAAILHPAGGSVPRGSFGFWTPREDRGAAAALNTLR